MLYNSYRAGASFDPYPYILLNLILSTIAAIQAPIIMMSQKRQETKDRLRSLNDYRVNLKAELEIRHLHEKIDHLLNKQWQRLAEIQELQLEKMQERKSSYAGPARRGFARCYLCALIARHFGRRALATSRHDAASDGRFQRQ